MIFNNVDLPIPLGPITANRSPRMTRSETSFSTTLSPKALSATDVEALARRLMEMP